MRFGSLKRHWERFGRTDPLWAVLTDPSKRRQGWDVDEFFETGRAEIDAVLARVAGLGLTVTRRRALDFGCGVGRLTQALARHFDRADGVDVSPSMLELARRYNRYPDRCVYHENGRPNLALFEDGAFSFAYSVLVLQHMEPRYSTGYIGELLRVLSPGGVLVFQVPSRSMSQVPSRSMPAAAAGVVSTGGERTQATGPLPHRAFKAALAVEPTALTLEAGSVLHLLVTVVNASPQMWPAAPNDAGRYGISVGDHWLDADGRMVERDEVRRELPHDVAPGSRVEVMLPVTVPELNGDYLLELDLVQEHVQWFADAGSPTVRIPCTVFGSEKGTLARSALPAGPIETADLPPFRQKYPVAYRLLRATRLRDLYWAWRRGVDRVKTRRDRVLAVIKPVAVNWWKRRRQRFTGPVMEMHPIAQDEVRRLIASGGGRLVWTEVELVPGFESCRYWVSKDVTH
jgi:SAM-dependent methyltransferase